MIHDIYKYAVNSMCHIFLQSAIHHTNFLIDEVLYWVKQITEDTPKDVLDYIEECIEVELREGWTYVKYGHPRFLEEVRKYIGEGYEDVFFYRIVERIYNKIKEEE